MLIGYLLVCRVGTFSLRKTRDVAVAGIGVLIMALVLAQSFSQVFAGK